MNQPFLYGEDEPFFDEMDGGSCDTWEDFEQDDPNIFADD